MKKHKAENIRVEGCRVIVLENPDKHGSPWVCVAEFNYNREVASSPSEAARLFSKMITA